MRYAYCYESPIGVLCFEEEQGFLVACHLDWQDGLIQKETPLIKEAYHQVLEYFDDKRTLFTVPIKLTGTSFQQRVYQALLEVSYGETVSYKELANAMNHPKAVRAVGGALNKNPLMLFVPCHRVIAHTGTIGGFAHGDEMKHYLLNREGVVIDA